MKYGAANFLVTWEEGGFRFATATPTPKLGADGTAPRASFASVHAVRIIGRHTTYHLGHAPS